MAANASGTVHAAGWAHSAGAPIAGVRPPRVTATAAAEEDTP